MDQDLRALEREARTDPEARLRYADALVRVGDLDGALAALRPLFLRCDGIEAGARLRTALILAERGGDAAYHLRFRFEREDVIVDAEYRALQPRLRGLIERDDDLAAHACRFFASHFPLDVVREEWPRMPRRLRASLAIDLFRDLRARANVLATVETDEEVRHLLETGAVSDRPRLPP